MATYNRVTPATLANWEPVIDDPVDTEAANKLAQVDLQTRRFVFDFLSSKFDETTGKLLAASLDATVSLTGLVSGSTSNAGTQRQVVQGTISTVDLRDSSVSTNKIADDAVTGAKIADGIVVTDHLAADAVTTAKILNANVTEAKLANDAVTADKLKDDATGAAGAVTTDHIRSNAVTTPKIADGNVTPAKLPVGSAVGQLLVTGLSPYTFAIKTMSGGATIDQDGVVTLATNSRCELVERKNNNNHCAASAAATWNVRGSSTVCAWVESWRLPTSAFVSVNAAGKITFSEVGTYILTARAPGYKVGKHISRIVRYNVSDVVQETFYGTSEDSPAADGAVTHTTARAKVVIGVTSDYVTLEHFTELLQASNGLGIATNSGGTYEIYATLEIEKVA